jgi:signal transduction histidine kinase
LSYNGRGIKNEMTGMVHRLQRLGRVIGLWVFFMGEVARLGAAELKGAEGNFPVETNLLQLPALISGAQRVGRTVALEGIILWVSAVRDQLIFSTVAGSLRVKMDLTDQPLVMVGQHIKLTGCGLLGEGVINEAVVDNDGLHGIAEKTGTVYLKAGWHPLRAEWFNGLSDFAFAVDYAGPGIERRPIPGDKLYRPSEQNSRRPGLNYSVYQGGWEFLPAWQKLIPVKQGSTTNFDLGVRSRDENVGIVFAGLIQIERDGLYQFWTKSDDGSRLIIGSSPLHIEILGAGAWPVPREIQPGQGLEEHDDFFGAATEGTVTGIHAEAGGGLQVTLTGKSGDLYLELNPDIVRPPQLFSRIRVQGICRNVPVAGGGFVAGRLLVSGPNQIQELAAPPAPVNFPVANVEKIRQLAITGQRAGFDLCLTGMVVATTEQPGLFAFQDETGGLLVKMDAFGAPVQPGDTVKLTGNGVFDGSLLLLNHSALIDNNGIHTRQEKTATMWLEAGKHPLHVSWFNRAGTAALELSYQGPQLARKKIPATALVHPEFAPLQSVMKWAQGLAYECYEGDWQAVPDLSRVDPVGRGISPDFDTHLTRRLEKTGLEFNGFLEVASTGQYFFSLAADDGALFFIDEQLPQIEITRSNTVPAWPTITPRQVLLPEQNNRWSKVEGMVNFAFKRGDSLFLELNSDYGPTSVRVLEGTNCPPSLLIGSVVQVAGFCQSAHMPDGQEVAAGLITAGMAQVRILKNSAAQWNRYPLKSVHDLFASETVLPNETVAHIRGKVQATLSDRTIILNDDTGVITVKGMQSLPVKSGDVLEAIGQFMRSETNGFLNCSLCRPLTDTPKADTKLTLLTTALQVKQLTRDEAQRGYPVKLRGVITLVRYSGTGFIIQDDTSAIDVWWQQSATDTSLPRVGDYWEVTGQTFAEFAPNIRAGRATRLGIGTMPESLHPTWDQLINGSLDTRYVELQGIVTAAESDGVMLLTRSGKIHVLLTQPPENLAQYLNALVRIRGCVVPIRNQVSQQIQVGQTRLTSVSLSVDEPPPADPFNTDLKRASDLLLFDVRAGSLQRVKIAGQIFYSRDGEIYLADGTNAVRVQLQNFAGATIGDRVEVVGFPELGGASPVLREALLRPTGHAALPAPVSLAAEQLFSKGHDGALVAVDAELLGVSGNQGEKLLEMQSGSREFVARLDLHQGNLKNLVNGSLLRLTGVYSEQGGLAAGRSPTAFELLLNSPAAVKILQQPPWWTLRRALIFAGSLAFIILLGAFWIFVLRRRIEERSKQLALEISRREQIQQQSALEKERSRIAKDMHDQIGTNVTQVGLLAELMKKNAGDAGKTIAQASKIGENVFELSRTLDEIVWAVNPKNDSLDKFCDYIAVQAQELFQLTDILCRVDLPPEIPRHPLSAEVRHNLFLAAKEALNNVARHSRAREVWVRFLVSVNMFELSIVDDGRGFTDESKHATRNGLQNMRKRLEDIGGEFTILSQSPNGTQVVLKIPLSRFSNPAV